MIKLPGHTVCEPGIAVTDMSQILFTTILSILLNALEGTIPLPWVGMLLVIIQRMKTEGWSLQAAGRFTNGIGNQWFPVLSAKDRMGIQAPEVARGRVSNVTRRFPAGTETVTDSIFPSPWTSVMADGLPMTWAGKVQWSKSSTPAMGTRPLRERRSNTKWFRKAIGQ